MSEAVNRRINLYINGEQVEGSLKKVKAEITQLNRALDTAVMGSDDYNASAARLAELNGVLRDHRRNVSGLGEAWKESGSAMDTAAKLFTADILLEFGAKVWEVGTAISSMSIKMDTVSRKSATVFKDQLGGIAAAADKSATSMGLSNTEYIEAATNIGDLLSPMGFATKETANLSTSSLGLAGALAEWSGGTLTTIETSKLLTDAMLGETDGLKAVGIAIDADAIKRKMQEQGTDKLTGKLEEQAKATATLALIMEKSTDAQAAYANGGDSIIRRQAEMSAKMKEAVETLAVALLPVFERLIGIASDVADGIGWVAEGFAGLIDPAKSAVDAFDEQAASVAALESELPGLLDRYEELKGKTTLTADEQKELGTVIERVGILTPGAITEVDKYGKALDINAASSRAFLEAEKARLKFVNKEAAAALETQIKQLETQAATSQRLLNSGKSINLVGFEADATDAEIVARQARLRETQGLLEGARAELARLTGTALGETEKTVVAATKVVEKNKEVATSHNSRAEDAAKAAKREAEAAAEGLRRIQETYEGYLLAFEQSKLSADAREIAQLEAKYAKLGEGAKGNAELLMKIELLKDAELEALRTAQMDKAFAEQVADAEAFQARIDAANTAYTVMKSENAAESAAFLAEREAGRIELRAQVANDLMTEQQREKEALRLHYEQLLLMADDYGVDVTGLREKWKTEEAKIDKKYADESVTKQREEHVATLTAYATLYTNLGNVISSAADLIGEGTEEAAGLHKLATLAQIAFDTASAISSAVAASSANPANAVTGGLAGIAQYATMVATILGNVKRARDVLKSAPAVKQKAEGGYEDVVGADDGRTYRARMRGRVGSGLLGSPSLVLAGERGPEYFVANKEMQVPLVADMVRTIENIRLGRMGVIARPQMAEGGYTGAGAVAASSDSTDLRAMMTEMNATLRMLTRVLAGGIHAKVSDATLDDMDERRTVLKAVR